ncbi:CBS domain-containing protein [Actinopolymorpha alba]|uniref:CBS domain-containing protein n=1 Tax=Actinopolymorpha alba TaxID=533267 RepID=UPI0003741A83|nr:CBS domain-containing protein [Actinopolymorpha alba]
MLARDLVEDYPAVSVDADALEAAQLLGRHRLPGLVVTAEDRRPIAVLPASQVVRFVIPKYIQDDPSLARVIDEKASDRIVHELSGLRVGDLLPERRSELPVLHADDTVLELAAVMARLRSPLVAIVDDGHLTGVVTASRLLELALHDT